MERLTPALQTYPWGSKTFLAELRGEPSPSATPEAELWFGAHGVGPSIIGETSLDTAIAHDPQATLGTRVRRRYGDNLPFLLKILAADEPLSVQAHPTREQARAGFEAENSAGIPLNSGNRNYKDPNHKPELLVALTPFRALAGFRPVAQTLALFEHLACPALDRYAAMLHSEKEEEGVRALFTTWISLPRTTRMQLIDDISASCTAHTCSADESWMHEAIACFVELGQRYPGDVGVLASLLLNYVELAPGEAMFLGAGRLHAYLSGMAIELMANSDNVLRCGLTPKHVDVPELVRILDFSTLDDPRIPSAIASNRASSGTSTSEFPVPIDDYVLTRHRLVADSFTVSGDGPSIVLCTAGSVVCTSAAGSAGSAGTELKLTPGTAAWIPAAEASAGVTVRAADNAEVFWARA